jgi:hypothetical protein
MSVQLHITMDDTLYARLKKEIRPKRISAFISEAVRAELGPARRGDVYWVALDPSNDSCNAHGRRVVVLPITSNVDSLYPGEGADPDQGSAGTRDPRKPRQLSRRE